MFKKQVRCIEMSELTLLLQIVVHLVSYIAL